ncbi:hypothetical protein [Aureibacter tunicatorum]|uniref:BioF2-like acetyltransferase domain-containing protein n=1 Tax=Aureibacter tunicatorum TaxID=866807 RepID=A0AAE3XMS2_9BACT|nr:hypothetical protein [Aureibacter tunicatorum]MDR6239332.1 hypothetical protein [Aureibacter tunicatorum]BDD04745.1 hypothetical protein AUTU_22280 [Aureibacter tunicatorum]
MRVASRYMESHCWGKKFSRNLNKVGVDNAYEFKLIDHFENQCDIKADNLFGSRDYLRLFEDSGNIKYLLVEQSGVAIGLVPIFLSAFDLKYLEKRLADHCASSKAFLNLLESKRKIAIVGNPFSCVESISVNEIVDQTLCEAVIRHLERAMDQEEFGDKVEALVFKDFSNGENAWTRSLEKLGFHKLETEPNMSMIVSPDWEELANYKADMKTKFRTKAKSVFKKSSDLICVDLQADQIGDEEKVIKGLYENVCDNAEFNLGKFDISLLKELKKNMPNDFFIKGYYYEGKMIGFASGFENVRTLEAFYVGFDYTLNKDLAIYQRMLYDYVEEAIKRKLVKLNFSRTAANLKNAVGAMPEQTFCYFKHKKSVYNLMYKIVSGEKETKPVRYKAPFKKEYLNQMNKITLAEY